MDRQENAPCRACLARDKKDLERILIIVRITYWLIILGLSLLTYWAWT